MNVGIDLGTTNTVVSYLNEFDEWRTLSFSKGRSENPSMLPSCLCVVNSNEIKVGQDALDERLVNANNFLCDTKYHMGDEKTVFSRGGITFTARLAAEKVLEEVMGELKRQFPEEETFNAFVTVPARFLEAARRETREALIKAGFEDNGDRRSLTDEPIAAAVAYSSALSTASNVLVVDYGGGTFDLSLVTTNTVGIASGMQNLSVKSWGGDLHLGGNDVDRLLINKMVEQFVKNGGRSFDPFSTFNNSDEQRAAALICAQPIEIKKQLFEDFTSEASVLVPDLLDGVDLEFYITPQEYEDMMTDISVKYQDCINKMFIQSKEVDISSVDTVLIVGGMAHEPCLRKVLVSLFHDESKLVIPDDSMYLVSKGASIWNSNADVHVENKVYTSIGILLDGGKDVCQVVKEGDLIDDAGKLFSGNFRLTNSMSSNFLLSIVEYQGEFSPGNYTILKSERVPVGRPRRTVFSFHNSPTVDVKIEIKMDADKLFCITVKQNGIPDRLIDLRLGN